MKNSKATILIVDDSITNIMLLSDILKDEYNIKIAKNGLKALEILNSETQIDLVLLDIEMPEINGYEVCIEAKNNQKTKNIPIIFVTGKTEQEDEEYGLNLGAIDYIIKPFSKPIIKLRIKNHILLKQKTDLLEQLSIYDSLTNIKNRRYFDENFERIYLESQRDGFSFAIFMLDIDFFKPYNDNYGHGKGDEVIAKVAKSIDKNFQRVSDIVARYGGEEFVIIVKNNNKETLIKLSENVMQSIQELNIEHDFSQISKYITISIGVALYESNSNIPKEKILTKADESLYLVKKSGRNNYFISEI